MVVVLVARTRPEVEIRFTGVFALGPSSVMCRFCLPVFLARGLTIRVVNNFTFLTCLFHVWEEERYKLLVNKD